MQYSTPKLKIEKRIEIVSTNTTNMKETGFGSLQTCRIITDILQDEYTDVSFRDARTEEDLQDIVKRNPDLVVLCVKYISDKKQINLANYFSKNNIPHTGSNEETLTFDSNKSKAKTFLMEHGIASASFFLAHPNSVEYETLLPLPLPLFVKPLDAANGNGIDENSRVYDWESYKSKVQEIYTNYGGSSLVEEILPGREFTVAILQDVATNSCQAYPVEIIPQPNSKGHRVLGAAEKRSNVEQVLSIKGSVSELVSSLAIEVFSILKVRDLGRIDIKLDRKGIPHFIEANLVPGLTPNSSYFPRSCNMDGNMSYEDVILKFVKNALSRSNLHTCPEKSYA